MNTFQTCLLVVLLATFTVGEPSWYNKLTGTKPKESKKQKTSRTPTTQEKISGFVHDIATMNNNIKNRYDKYESTAQQIYLESVKHVSTLVEVVQKRDPDHKCTLPLLHNLVDLKINTLRDIKECINTGSRKSSKELESYKQEANNYKGRFDWYVKQIEKCPSLKCSNRLIELHLEDIHKTIGKWYMAHARYAVDFSILTSSTMSCVDVAVTRAESNLFIIERNANCPLAW